MMPGHACSGYAVTEQGHHPLIRSKAPVVLLMDSQCSLKRDIRAVVTPTFKCTSPKLACVRLHPSWHAIIATSNAGYGMPTPGRGAGHHIHALCRLCHHHSATAGPFSYLTLHTRKHRTAQVVHLAPSYTDPPQNISGAAGQPELIADLS